MMTRNFAFDFAAVRARDNSLANNQPDDLLIGYNYDNFPLERTLVSIIYSVEQQFTKVTDFP